MSREDMENKVRVWPVPVLFVPAVLVGAAHLWRAGNEGEAAACVLWTLLCFSRRAWMRPVCLLMLFLFTAEWMLTTQTLLDVRLAMGAPWIRLVVILQSAAAFTAAAGIFIWNARGRAWFCRGGGEEFVQAAAFLSAALPMLGMAHFAPHLLLMHRLLPGFGALQALAAGLWSAGVCSRLLRRDAAGRTRMFVWRLFSVVFFVQFALAMAGWPLFAMTGNMHIPVPGVIVAGALYRGTAGFMPVLFLVCVLLVGAAWCSHLCYFGSWDARAAAGARPVPHPGPLRRRALSLAVVVCGTLILHFFAPFSAAVAGGIALGLLMLPVSVFVSRRKGYAAYCTLICPLGLLACLAGRISPWRIRRTSSCTGCGACLRVCRYGALDRQRLEAGSPGLSCTLCRDCLNTCAHGGLAVTCFCRGAGGRAERVFVVMVSALHALFLFSAMV